MVKIRRDEGEVRVVGESQNAGQVIA